MKMGYSVHCINEEISVRQVILTVDWHRNLPTISQVCIDTQCWTASWACILASLVKTANNTVLLLLH